MDPSGIQEVRKIIESSTSKVSLRDLEKKGFRKVKVLRSNDIDELVRRAVTAVVAREGGSEGRVSEEIVERSRQELKRLMASTQAAERERAELIERNESLEAELGRLRARPDGGERAERAEAKLRDAEQRLEEVARRFSRAEDETRELRRRVQDAEARAERSPRLEKEAAEAGEKYSALKEELETLRIRAKQLEMERRLVEELEVPKLRERIQELEAELRVQKAAALASPRTGVDDDKMRSMFREILREVGAGASIDGGALKAELAKIQGSIAEALARAGGRGERVTAADLDAAKVSIEALFKHETGEQVESNISDVKMKETTTTSDLKSSLSKLKALRKGGSSE